MSGQRGAFSAGIARSACQEGRRYRLRRRAIDNAQLRADETRLRAKVRGDVFERLLKTIAEEKAKMAKQEAAQAPRLDVSHGEDADGEAAN
jgi:hypothetical protein